jgi:hypothetical protein
MQQLRSPDAAGGDPPTGTRLPELAVASGNPGLLFETLRPTVALHDLAATSLDGLPPPAAALLRAASVRDGSFELDVVSHAAGLNDDAALEAMESAHAAGLIVEVGDDRPRSATDSSIICFDALSRPT